MSLLTYIIIFLAIFSLLKISGIIAISKFLKPTEEQIEEARRKRLQAEKDGKNPFEDWDREDDEDWK